MKMLKSTAALLIAAMMLSSLVTSCSGSGAKSDSEYKGVQIGVITYSWRSMPGTAADILNYCEQTGISSLELMGNVVEEYAGAPARPARPENWSELSDEDQALFNIKVEEYGKELSDWRISNASSEKYKELKKMFNDAGVNIHIVKFSPAGWSDEEIDYAFESAKLMGAGGVSNEIGHEACERLGKFAEKHEMYAIFHNHGQPGDSTFIFEEFLAYSPNNMLNLDVGHYFGATGKHPNELIEKLHDRIFSIHLKDKTGKDADPADTNAPWGEGDTPLEDILTLIQTNQWDIYCDIELEYEIPEDSDAVKEVGKCVEYCNAILL
ncbi:MAG: sugar phosphate isomerase/epimerase [Bacteroidota bacterium]